MFAVLGLAVVCASAEAPRERVLVYKLRGEVRPLLFWVGRDEVGGGRITIRESGSRPVEIEVLFGSDPDRIPRRVNRWGYGSETAEWSGESLLATEFQGIMRHSEEASIADVPSAGAAGLHRYDVTRSTVHPGRAEMEFRILSDPEEFHYRHPERLLAKYRESFAAPPLKTNRLCNGPPVPHGFLTGVWELARQAESGKRSALTFVYNTKPYTLEVRRLRRQRDAAVAEFRCFNTVKKTRTDFTLWLRNGVPVRIVLQPRWWLRLQLDLVTASSRT